MYRLRSINPRTGYIKEFDAGAGGPVLIGRIPLEKVFENIDILIENIPDEFKQKILEDIRNIEFAITMADCKISYEPISRFHCLIFPGDDAKITDLFSTNGTVIGSIGGGLTVNPGRDMDLKRNDIILLANGSAIFQYLGSCETDENHQPPREKVIPKYPQENPDNSSF